MLNTQSRGTLNLEQLSAYHYFNDFHLLLYSRASNNTPLFFLHRTSKDQTFSHISGTFSKDDTSVILATAKAFLTQTRGLLSASNLKYFTAENPTPLDENTEITIESLPVKPQLKYSPACDDICRQLAESPFHFQNPKGTKVQFIELPMLNLEAIKGVAESKGINFEGRYFSLDEIIDAKSDSEVCGTLKDCLRDPQLFTYLDTFIVKSEPIENQKHYAVLSCDIWNTNSLLPMFFYSPWKKHGESWKFYKVFKSELPTDEELAKLDGIIIPGSSCSAYDDTLVWTKDLFECIRKIIYTYKHINLLGICFGAQVIAEALGGKTCKMDRDFIRGGDVQNLQPSFFELEYIKSLGFDSSLKLVLSEAHGDHISELPAGAVLHASSINTNVEIFTIGDNVLAIQAHPEVNEAWSAGAEYRWIKPKEEYEKFAEEFIKTSYPEGTTHDEILKICFSFLKKEGRSL